jgi:hypothetical protein
MVIDTDPPGVPTRYVPSFNGAVVLVTVLKESIVPNKFAYGVAMDKIAHV